MRKLLQGSQHKTFTKYWSKEQRKGRLGGKFLGNLEALTRCSGPFCEVPVSVSSVASDFLAF